MANKKNEEDKHIEIQKIYRIPRFIDDSEVLQFTNRGWYIGGRKLADPEISALRAEALDFSKSYLWQLMRKDIHYTAYLQATAKRHTELDAVYAGAMYRDLEILEKFLKQCKSL